jgi:hypothetical protein
MTVSSGCYGRHMSAEYPHLYTERPIFQAARELIRQTESSMDGHLEEPVRLIMTGGAAMALYSPTRSSEDVDAIFSHRIVLPEVLVPYVDEHGRRCTLTWDRNYAPVIGLMHPDAEEDAIFVAQSPDRQFDILALSPIDLAVSKLGRYADNDQRDIQELYTDRLITPQALEARAEAAMRYYVGNVGQVHHNTITALQNMGYQPTIQPPSKYIPLEPTRPKRNDAQRLAEGGGSGFPTHCLSRGQATGILISLSEDRSVAFLSPARDMIAVYRSDYKAMSELSAFKGKLVTLLEQGHKLTVRDRDKERGKGRGL